VLNELLQWFNKKNLPVLMPETLTRLVKNSPDNVKLASYTDMAGSSDFILSLGGDGTMLGAASLPGIEGTPLIGINLGGLGFLTQASAENMIERLERLINGEFRLEKRMMLETKIKDSGRHQAYRALNDVVFTRADSPRMMRTDVFVDGVFFNTYVSDGLIVSTPTGSTAYSLSAGGPILVPELEAVILNPICPHAVTARATIVPADRKLTVSFSPADYEPVVSVDGQPNIPIAPGTEISIEKAEQHTLFVSFAEADFFTILREKLQWGRLPHK